MIRGSYFSPKSGYSESFPWVFVSPSKQMPVYYLQLGHNHFRAQPLQLIIHVIILLLDITWYEVLTAPLNISWIKT
jgi:hypothetical protein